MTDIHTVEALDRIAAQFAVHAPHRLPLLAAVRTGQISLAEYMRHAPAEMGKLKRIAVRPVLVVIGDDDGAGTGPKGWAAAAKLIKWADAFLVHGAGGEPRHYETAILMAKASGRLLLIESDSENLAAWINAIPRGKPSLIIKTSPSTSHPRLTEKRAMH